MRSAWSPTRSMSFETLFDVWPNCLLALPTLLATDWTSTFERRGTGIPRIFFWREWPFSTRPPAMPTAVAPTAMAGPLTLLAAPLIVPTTPPFPVPFWLAVLRLELLLLLLLRPAPLRLAAGFFRALALLDREAVVRPLVAAFGRLRDEPLPALALALDLGLDLGPELLDVARPLPCPLREVD